MRPKSNADEQALVVDRWSESKRAMVLVRVPCARVIGPNELSDLRTRSLTAKWRNALVPSTYSRPRDLSHWPDRTLPSGVVRSTDGVGTVQPKTFASKTAQEAYALRAELGDRAYAELTGKRKRTRAVAKPSAKQAKADAQAAIRTRADGGGVVSLSDHELVKALGIKPIGYLD